MTSFNKIKILLLELYLVIMSGIIFGTFLYFRLIMKRAAYSLELLKDNLDLKYLIICSFFTLLHLFIIIFIMIQLMNKNKSIVSSLYIIKIKKIIEFFVYKPLNHTLTTLAPCIPYSGTLIIHYCYFFRENIFRLFLCKLLCFCLYFFPRILMALLFFIEIVYYNQVKYFIILIFTFIIPYIYIIFLNLSEKFYSNNITELDNALIVTPIGKPNIHGVFTEHKIQLKEESAYSKEDFDSFTDSWSVLFSLLNLNAIIRNFISDYASYITIITSSCYFIALSYQLYYFLT